MIALKNRIALGGIAIVLATCATLVLIPSHAAHANTLTVTTNADSGAGSLRQTIADAGSGDTILFDSSLSGATIVLGGSPLVINKNLTITGPQGGITVDGNSGSRVLDIDSGVVAISFVNVTGGSALNYGGGIQLDGTLTLSDMTISGSTVSHYGAGLAVMSGSATLTNTTVSGNVTTSGYAGGIVTFGNLSLTNATISGNTSNFSGSGLMLLVPPSGSLTANLLNVTISGNTTVDGNAALEVLPPPDTTVNLNIHNSIIASQANGDDCRIFAFDVNLSEGNNIASNGTCPFSQATDHPNSNPMLGPLALRAPGATMTHSLLAGSPAIDGGDDGTCPPADQRGVVRPLGTHCDIGSYERVPDLTQGDVDCNASVNSVDALKVLRSVAALPVSQTQPCPALGANIGYLWGDVDCKGEPTSVDALLILRHNAGLLVQQQEPCTDLGSVIPGG